MRFFLSIVRKFGGCDVDLFVSRVNAQLKSYVSWRPDPDAMAVVFTLDWSTFRALFSSFQFDIKGAADVGSVWQSV